MKLHPALLAALPALTLALPCSASLLLYDSFSSDTGEVPTGWTTLGSGSNNDYVTTGTLSLDGLAESAGGKWTHDNSTSQLYHRDFSSTPLATGETVYYSLILQVNNITGLKVPGTGNTDYALLGLSTNSVTAFSNLASNTVGIRQDPDDAAKFKLLLGNQFRLNTEANVYEPTSFALGEQILIVASFTRGTTTSNGTANFWINPDTATFGESTVPAASVTMTSNNTAIQSFLIATAGSGQASNYPASWSMDELRIGNTWADVTPALIPEPASAVLLGGLSALACATLRRRRHAAQ